MPFHQLAPTFASTRNADVSLEVAIGEVAKGHAPVDRAIATCCLACTVRVTPQGFELAEALNGKKPHARFTARTEAELYEWFEKFRQSNLEDGWEPTPE